MHDPHENEPLDAAPPSKVATGRPDLSHLLVRCTMSDERAFAELYDATSSQVFGLAMRVLRNSAHAEEVVQEAYVDVWRQASRYDPGKGSAQSWIFTIVHRKAVDRVRQVTASERRDRAHHDGAASIAHDSTSEMAIASTEATRVRAAVGRLTPLQRDAIDLAYFGGHTHVEVAALLEIPLGTAKTRIRDGLQRLRLELEPDDI